MKAFFVDTAATVIFFTGVAAIAELAVAGMDPQQVLVARLIMVPVMIATGRLYGVWRDWVFARFRPQRRATRTLSDVVAFTSFQIPVYMLTLAAVGTTAGQMVAAAGTAVVGMAILSRPFGLFLEFVRRRAGVSSAAA